MNMKLEKLVVVLRLKAN